MNESGSTGSERRPQSLFERHRVLVLALLTGSVIVVLLGASELLMRGLLGLSNPVIYEPHPLYGYRPRPNQDLRRFGGAQIRINNLGLRANADWDSSLEGKVLFLGDSVTYGGSYVSNDQLFSQLAVVGLDGLQSGNAAVNGWGVENVYGLLVQAEFLPARTYVSVFILHDFYRRLTSHGEVPYWEHPPSSAFAELISYVFYRQGKRRLESWRDGASAELVDTVAGLGVEHLAEVDAFLRGRGFNHLIYISPTIQQVVDGDEKDPWVRAHLDTRGLEVVYLLDRIRALGMDREELEALFRDEVHLSVSGHALWGRLIRSDLQALVDIAGAGSVTH